jgi:hypothetical protein
MILAEIAARRLPKLQAWFFSLRLAVLQASSRLPRRRNGIIRNFKRFYYYSWRCLSYLEYQL